MVRGRPMVRGKPPVTGDQESKMPEKKIRGLERRLEEIPRRENIGSKHNYKNPARKKERQKRKSCLGMVHAR